jgi:DNA-binding beta-propeller fold protein YncE
MQYLDGETLAERLEKGALPLDLALRYAIEIANALDKAHGAGIVHRDLKPGNIKLTAAGAKLLDFGLAKTAAPLIAGTSSMAPTTPVGLTAQGTILGTLQYMAPEQLEGLEADARTDVFAFGAVLFEMVTGARAFHGGSQASLVGAILKDAPKPMSSAQTLAPPSLERVILTCLEKRPDDRWQSMRDLARELKWIAHGAKDTASTVASSRPSHARLAWSIAAVAVRWDTKARSTLIENASAPTLTASGHLLFSRDDRVMVASFDASRRAVGPASPLSESVVMDQFGVSQLAVSRTGTLVYVAADPAAPVPAIGLVTRAGPFTEVGALQAGMDYASLSPDGTQALVSSDGSSKVSIVDLTRGVSTPVALGTRTTETASWHPDGKRVTLGGAYLSLFDPDTGTETRLTPTGRPKRFASWAPDGRRVAYHTFEPTNNVYWLSLKDNSSEIAQGPGPLGGPGGAKAIPVISPDGEWVAYRATSDDGTGRLEVFLARFPEGTGRVQVTRAGGGNPFWSRQGDELFFQGPPAGELYRVPVTLSAERAQIGAPHIVLKPPDDMSIYAVSPDGTRFLALKGPRIDPPREIVVVEHWLDDLRRAVPVP